MINKCFYYEIARRQRQTEIDRGEGTEGTSSYYERGCLNECDGNDSICLSYIDPQRLLRKINPIYFSTFENGDGI